MSNESADRLGKWLAIGGTVLAATAVVLAIRTMGTPTEQRQVRIDERRIEDLNDIEVALNAAPIDKLPANLTEFAAQPGGRIAFKDPETGAPYEYERIDDTRFRLCAVFATDTALKPSEAWPANEKKWSHGVGRQCFTRTIKAD